MEDIKPRIAPKGVKIAALVLAITGLVFSVLAFIGSLLGLLGYSALFLIATLLVIVVIAIIYLVVYGVMFILLFIINFIALFITALIQALFSSSSSSSFEWITFDGGPGEIVSPEFWSTYGLSVLGGVSLIPIFIVGIVLSLLAMIFSIVALVRVCKSRSRGGFITGGIFAIFSSVLGLFSPLEFIAGVLMFILHPKKEKPKQITMK